MTQKKSEILSETKNGKKSAVRITNSNLKNIRVLLVSPFGGSGSRYVPFGRVIQRSVRQALEHSKKQKKIQRYRDL